MKKMLLLTLTLCLLFGAAARGEDAADMLLNDGERWAKLFPYGDTLVGVAEGADGQQCLRIARRDGAAYVLEAETGWTAHIDGNDIGSGGDFVMFDTDSAYEMMATRDADGVWRLFSFWMEEDDRRVYLTETGFIDYTLTYDPSNSDVWYYGQPTFPVELDGLDFSALPGNMAEAVAQLDATGWACVKQQDACLYDAPGGHLLATCYLRLPGRVIAEEGDWVQLQIGSEKEGTTGWFRREALAFGDEVNQVVCSFPAMADDWYFDSDDVDERFPGLTARLWDEDESIAPWELHIWLVGRTVDGGWLVLVEEEYICTAPAEVIGETGPTSHLWDW